MKLHPLSLAAAGCLCVTGISAQDGEYTTELKYKPQKAWNVILPNETWTEVQGFPIPHAEGDSFDSEKTGLSLSVDSDADGDLDHRIKGAGGFVVLKGKRPDGSKLQYAARVKLAGSVYKFSASGSMNGSIFSVPVRVIDQNNNGVYNEYGVDAMVVGKSAGASFLSKVINIKNELYDFEVSADGRSVTVKPYEGEVGTLSLRKGLKLKGKLLAAVVSEQNSPISFNVANAGSLKVPVGSYTFTGGFAKKGSDTAMLRAGKMKPIEVEADKVASLKWGVPLIAEFDFTRDGNNITVQPDVKFIGAAGEEWHTLLPDAKSPKLNVFDEDSNKLIASKRFPGC